MSQILLVCAVVVALLAVYKSLWPRRGVFMPPAGMAQARTRYAEMGPFLFFCALVLVAFAWITY